MGDDATRLLGRAQAADGVVCAAELEGAHALQVLALQEQLIAAGGIQEA